MPLLTRAYIVAALIILCAAGQVRADETAGIKPAVGIESARILALGGSCIALDVGAYGIGKNPAVLSLNPALGVTFTERALAAPRSHRLVAALSVPLEANSAVSFAFDDLWSGKITGYNRSGEPTGEFSYHDRTFGGAFSRYLYKVIGVGGAFRYRRVSYLETPYSGAFADAGAVINPVPTEYFLQDKYGVFTFGFSINNIAIKTSEYPSGAYKPKPGVNGGVSWSREISGLNKITFTWEYGSGRERPLNIGFEYSYAYTVHGRAGYDGSEPSFGIGFSKNLFDFDYAFIRGGTGLEHIVTFSLFPGRDVRAEAEKKRAIGNWLKEGRAYYELGNYELATRRFKNALEWDKDNEMAMKYLVQSKYEAYIEEGCSFLEKENWERARRAFNAALAIMPGDFLAEQYRARTDELEREAARLAAIETRVLEVLAQVNELNRRGLYAKSVGILTDALKEIPDREELTAALSKTKRLLAATAAVKAPVEVVPLEIPAAVKAQFKRADELLSAGRTRDAIGILEPIVTEYPHYYEAAGRLVESYMYEGLDLYSKGYLESAIAYWRKVLAIDPANEKAKRYIEKAEREAKKIRGE